MTQYRFRKPELIPTLFMLVAVTFLFSLGVWQLYRLQWKTALIAHIEEMQAKAPEDFLKLCAHDQTPSDLEWRNVRVSGVLMNDKELYATPRYYKQQMGYAILTPLAVNTPKGVEYIMLNRGWVPPEKKLPDTRKDGKTAKEVVVDGVLRGNFKQNLFRPDNRPDKNLWFWYDIPAMAEYTHLNLLPVMIDVSDIKQTNGHELESDVTPFPLEITIPNDHLGYAITWFLISLAGVVMYVSYYLEKKE